MSHAGRRTATLAATAAALGWLVLEKALAVEAVADEDPHEDNTFGLPDGTPIRAALKAWFRRQKARTLTAIPPSGPLPPYLPTLAGDTGPMAEAMTPLLSAYWDEAGKATLGKLGLDPDEWRVVDPNTKAKIEGAALDFCEATNATTSLKLGTALEKLRDELVRGIVEEGESIPELTKRVQSIFDKASKSRAQTIARTETSRAVHSASLESARQSGVVAGKQWLLSSNACEQCQAAAAKTESDAIPLDAEFDHHAGNPTYASIVSPPLHPHCRCSVTYQLTPEYEALLADEGPPHGSIEPGPLGPMPKDYDVHHPAVADRVPKPEGRPEPPPMPESTPAEPKPKPKKPRKPKAPPFPTDPEALEVVRALGGSTGAELVRDADGRLYVRKRGKNAGHLREEVHADDAYRALGVAVPRSKLYEGEAGPVKLSEFHEGVTLGELLRTDPAAAEAAIAKARKGMAADALLANWDVVGSGWDNLLVTKSGEVLRIDNGGSLRYRAQGAIKPAHNWTGVVGELDSLRDANVNKWSAKVFGGLSDDEARKQAKALVRKRKALLAAVPAELREVLGARLDTLANFARPKKAQKPKAIAGWKPKPASAFRSWADHDTHGMDDWGKAAYADWAKGLNTKETRALREYTGSDYVDMNRALRTGQIPPGEKERIDTLTKALERGKLKEDITVFRGVRRLADLGVDASKLQYGDLIQEKGFSSTSLKSDVSSSSFGTGALFRIRVPAGTPGAYVNASSSGSSIPREKEFLLPPGRGYRVIEVKRRGSVPEIIVELAQ
jgi:hypothetical protein